MNSPQGSDPGRTLVFALSLILVGALAVGAGYSVRSHGRSNVSLSGASAAPDIVRGVVQSVTADSVTLQTDAGPVTLKITPSTSKEALQKTSLASIKPGDWVNAGGVHHDQTIYALTALVVIPAAGLESGR